MARTDEGKALRKQYENHEIRHGFDEHREMELRSDGVSNTLSTVQKDTCICVAMRGRNPDNPSDRTAGVHTEQRLEPNTEGICNTLTSVQKDNCVLEKGNIEMDKEMVGIRQATHKGYIECEIGGVADFSYPTSEFRRGRVQGCGNICPTITSQSMGICRVEKAVGGVQRAA